MSFDFVGTCLDESTEDLGTIQVNADTSVLLAVLKLYAVLGLRLLCIPYFNVRYHTSGKAVFDLFKYYT